MSNAVTLADIERLCWHLSGWSVQQRDVDRLLEAVDAYAQGLPAPAPAPAQEGPGEEVGQLLEAVRADPQHVVHTGDVTVRVIIDSAPAGPPVQPSAPTVQTTPEPVPVPVPEPETVSLQVRTCTRCREEKPLGQFHRDPRGSAGRKRACRTCENKRKRDNRARIKGGETGT